MLLTSKWDACPNKRIFSSAHAFIIVFDITNITTFENVENWLRDVARLGHSGAEVIIVGNRIDEDDKRVVAYCKAKEQFDAKGK